MDPLRMAFENGLLLTAGHIPQAYRAVDTATGQSLAIRRKGDRSDWKQLMPREQGDFVTGRRVMKAMLPLMTVLERGGKFVQCVKYACDFDGLPAGETVRLPLRPMKKELKRTMRDALVTARTTISNILKNA